MGGRDLVCGEGQRARASEASQGRGCERRVGRFAQGMVPGVDPDTADMRTWLDKRGIGEHLRSFEKHKIDFEVLGDITYDDLKEIGIVEVGPRRKVFRAITMWRDERDQKKAVAIRARMEKGAPCFHQNEIAEPHPDPLWAPTLSLTTSLLPGMVTRGWQASGSSS